MIVMACLPPDGLRRQRDVIRHRGVEFSSGSGNDYVSNDDISNDVGLSVGQKLGSRLCLCL